MKDAEEKITVRLGASRVGDWARENGISRSQAYEEIRAGRLIARKCGTATLITDEDGAAWRRSLPKMNSAEEPAAWQNAARMRGGVCIFTGVALVSRRHCLLSERRHRVRSSKHPPTSSPRCSSRQRW
jgi:hypothetical protein